MDARRSCWRSSPSAYVATATPTLGAPLRSRRPRRVQRGWHALANRANYCWMAFPMKPGMDARAYNPPVDAVQEVRVKAFDSDSSFGHTGGGTMNQVMKTGTNGLHGSLWEFNQPSDMVANDFFRNRGGQGLQITHFNQYGLTVGGPMVLPHFNGRNKLFWFFAFEGLKDSQPNPTFLTVPTDAERQGDFSALLAAGSQYQLYNPFTAVLNGTTITRSPFPNNVIPQNLLNPIALAYMKFYPEPNVTVGVSAIGTNNYSSPATTTDNYNNQLGRLDYNMSDKNRMFFDVRTASETQSKNIYLVIRPKVRCFTATPLGATLDDVYMINPTTVADARINFTRLAETHGCPARGTIQRSSDSPLTLRAIHNTCSYPSPPSPLSRAWARPARVTIHRSRSSYSATWLRCTAITPLSSAPMSRQYRMNFIVFGNSTGTFSFNNSWDKALKQRFKHRGSGSGSRFVSVGPSRQRLYDLKSSGMFYNYYAAGFIQDDWRVAHNLTVNLGLRYDHDGAVHEKYGRTVDGFDTTDPNPIAAQAEANYAKNPIAQIPVSASRFPAVSICQPQQQRGLSEHFPPTKSARGLCLESGFSERHSHPRRLWHVRRAHHHRQSGGHRRLSTNPILAQEGFSQTTADDGHE